MSNWTEKEAIKTARKFYGLPKFERNCRLAAEGNRMKKAYKIPGTREHGEYSMLCEQVRAFVRQLTATQKKD